MKSKMKMNLSLGLIKKENKISIKDGDKVKYRKLASKNK